MRRTSRCSRGIAGAGAVLGAIGVYYNLDSRDAANAVSPQHADERAVDRGAAGRLRPRAQLGA